MGARVQQRKYQPRSDRFNNTRLLMVCGSTKASYRISLLEDAG